MLATWSRIQFVQCWPKLCLSVEQSQLKFNALWGWMGLGIWTAVVACTKANTQQIVTEAPPSLPGISVISSFLEVYYPLCTPVATVKCCAITSIVQIRSTPWMSVTCMYRDISWCCEYMKWNPSMWVSHGCITHVDLPNLHWWLVHVTITWRTGFTSYSQHQGKSLYHTPNPGHPINW